MKSFGVTSVLLLTLGLANPSPGEAQVLRPNELCSGQPDAAIATFEDANLEARVRSALSVGAQDDLTCGLVSGLTRLAAAQAGIGSLAGVQNLASLTDLRLGTNSLTSLTFLNLNDSPALSDIQPLLDDGGLGAGDFVDVRRTSVSCTDVAALAANGVDVTSDCGWKPQIPWLRVFVEGVVIVG